MRSLNVTVEWETVETRTSLWCDACSLPSCVSVVGVMTIDGGARRVVAIQQCVECGTRTDPAD